MRRCGFSQCGRCLYFVPLKTEKRQHSKCMNHELLSFHEYVTPIRPASQIFFELVYFRAY